MVANKISFGAFIIDFFSYIYSYIWHNGVAVIYIIQSLACFTIWVKVFEFMATNRHFSFYIKAVIEIFKQASYFFFLYLFALIAFGCTFVILGFKESFFTGLYYVYLLFLGEFDYEFSDSITSTFLTILFLIATIIGVIVMLNLLIAVVCQVYDDISQADKIANLQQRASMIDLYATDVDESSTGKPGEVLILVQKRTNAIEEKKDEVVEEEEIEEWK